MIFQVLSAIVGTFCFSILFSIPIIYCFLCALTGGLGWLIYLLLIDYLGVFASTLIASMCVVFLSRVWAIKKRCPATLFIIAGIFPLVPGAGVYWTTYYIVKHELSIALNTGYIALQCALALVLGIVFIFEIPQNFFKKLCQGRVYEKKLNKLF